MKMIVFSSDSGLLSPKIVFFFPHSSSSCTVSGSACLWLDPRPLNCNHFISTSRHNQDIRARELSILEKINVRFGTSQMAHYTVCNMMKGVHILCVTFMTLRLGPAGRGGLKV